MALREISANELNLNPFDKIGKEYFLVTAGDKNGYNTMTASWGFMGVMWHKNVFITVIRPNRYTYEFIEKNEYFTASFLPADKKSILNYCGTRSGRECDKAKEAGLTPLFIDNTTAFEQADMILVCKKLYSQDMDINLLPENLKEFYQKDPMHKQYFGEIVKILVNQ